jgi:hypothetical protein
MDGRRSARRHRVQHPGTAPRCEAFRERPVLRLRAGFDLASLGLLWPIAERSETKRVLHLHGRKPRAWQRLVLGQLAIVLRWPNLLILVRRSQLQLPHPK